MPRTGDRRDKNQITPRECKPWLCPPPRFSPPHAPPAIRAASKPHTGRTHQNLPVCALPERETPQGDPNRKISEHNRHRRAETTAETNKSVYQHTGRRDNCANKQQVVALQRPTRSQDHRPHRDELASQGWEGGVGERGFELEIGGAGQFRKSHSPKNFPPTPRGSCWRAAAQFCDTRDGRGGG